MSDVRLDCFATSVLDADVCLDCFATSVLDADVHLDCLVEVGMNKSGSEWWRSGKLWLIVTLVVVMSGIALSWIHWITVNDQWVTIKEYFQNK